MTGWLRRRNSWAGLLLLVLGLGVTLNGWALSLGTLAEIGPGFFPAALGVVLGLLGVAVAVSPPETEDVAPPPDLRGVAAIIGGLVAFLVLGGHAGLIPATFALVFVAAMGDRQMSPRGAAVLAAAITVVAVLLFHYALQVQFPLLGFR